MWMEKAQRRAGLPTTGAYHILRHTFCSHLAMQGATGGPGHHDIHTLALGKAAPGSDALA